MGAGTALVKWGTRAADEQGVKVITLSLLASLWITIDLQAIVEGTPVGRLLYERCGLRAEIEEMQFDVGKEFRERKLPKLIFLTREPES